MNDQMVQDTVQPEDLQLDIPAELRREAPTVGTDLPVDSERYGIGGNLPAAAEAPLVKEEGFEG
jgi:hypothetical protein